MIGGSDVIFDAGVFEPQEALRAGLRCVKRTWPDAVFEDGGTGRRYQSFAAIPFAHTNELLVYRDLAAWLQWEAEGAVEASANTMVHLIAKQEGLTVVVDDRQEAAMARIVSEIGTVLSEGVNPYLRTAA
jgi:hypothetical protein